MADNITITTPSRRAVIAGASTLAAASAANVAAIVTARSAEQDLDAELRGLWAEYLERTAEHAAATAAYRKARAPFERARPPCPENVLPGDHWEALRPLWNKHGLEPLADAWNVTDDRVRDTIARIHSVRATSLFGVAVKLAAIIDHPEEEDVSDAVRSALADIDAMVGGNAFATAFLSAEAAPLGLGDYDDEVAQS
jgi:hypothetical protein